MNGHRCGPGLLYVIPSWQDKYICLMLGESLSVVNHNYLHIFLKVFPYYSIHSKGQPQVSSATNLGRRHLQKKIC